MKGKKQKGKKIQQRITFPCVPNNIYNQLLEVNGEEGDTHNSIMGLHDAIK